MSTIEVDGILTTKTTTNDITVFHGFYNAGEKEIKYITFSYLPYNPVNDIVADEAQGELTGPIRPKRAGRVEWKRMWSVPTITRAVLTRIHIQYMDDSEETIDGKDVMLTNDPRSAYYNEVTVPSEKADEQEQRVFDAGCKLYGDNVTPEIIAQVFSEFKNEEELLLKVLGEASPNLRMKYFLGDYIEKEYSSHEMFMKRAVELWKDAIDFQKKYYLSPGVKECLGFPEKYAEKIKKYEPAYMLPESSFIGKLVEKIMLIINKK